MPRCKKRGPGVPVGTNTTHALSNFAKNSDNLRAQLEEIYTNEVDKTNFKAYLKSFEEVKDLHLTTFEKQQLAVAATIIQKYDKFMMGEKDFDKLMTSHGWAKLVKDYREWIFKILGTHRGEKKADFLSDVKKTINDMRGVDGKITIEWKKDSRDELRDIDCIDITPVDVSPTGENIKKSKKEDETDDTDS